MWKTWKEKEKYTAMFRGAVIFGLTHQIPSVRETVIDPEAR